ncbi:MAG: DUF1501 domain-containing protein [Bacteroidia bacterium]|nr:DUF1501 domain-containing protein [Bacteroidia bacterium]
MMEGLSRMYHDGHGDGEVRYLYKILAEAEQSVDYLYRQSKVYKAKMEFPNSELGRDLKLISELINAGTSTRVYYVSLSGFDTHINQKIQQDRGLRIYGEALAAFVRELKAGGRWQQVMVMTFSEFGRRVEQNASAGTDHGKANCLFLAGGSLKTKGIYNALPDLGDLQEGDLRYSVDFRSVYAGLLKGWLGTDPSTILGGDFELFLV